MASTKTVYKKVNIAIMSDLLSKVFIQIILAFVSVLLYNMRAQVPSTLI